VKHVLRYMRDTVGHGMRYTSSIDMIWQEYIDSDWVGSAVDRKRTFGCCFTLGYSFLGVVGKRLMWI
jgi:hypothetical protein